MRFLVPFLELVAVFVPDFLTLALVATPFFSLCCIVGTLGHAGTDDCDSAFKISLGLGYFVTIVLNIVRSLLTPARSTTPTSSWSESKVEPTARESLARTVKVQPVEHKAVVIKS